MRSGFATAPRFFAAAGVAFIAGFVAMFAVTEFTRWVGLLGRINGGAMLQLDLVQAAAWGGVNIVVATAFLASSGPKSQIALYIAITTTYLALLVALLAWLRLTGGAPKGQEFSPGLWPTLALGPLTAWCSCTMKRLLRIDRRQYEVDRT